MKMKHKYYSWDIKTIVEVDSTMNEINKLANAGADPGLVLVAESQTLGRGRQGRKWVSPKGNLYCSMLISPPLNKELPNSVLAFVAGISVVEAIVDITSGAVCPNLKWPNDIIVSGKKIAGILIEGKSVGSSIISYFIGIGVNLKSHPKNLKSISTDIFSISGLNITSTQTVKKIIERIDVWLFRMESEGFEIIRKRWLDLSIKIGSNIKVNTSDITIHGIFKGLSLDGSLLLQTQQGNIINILSGDVSQVEKNE